jgi:formylglycine-generating enzyme required for sulfatase activity
MSNFHTRRASGRARCGAESVQSVLRHAGIAAALVSAAVALAAVPAAHGQTACDADLDNDGTVGAADLARILGAWGPCRGCTTDIDGSGAIDAADIAVLLSLWGQVCSPLPWATVLEQEPNPAVVTSAAQRAAIVATGLPWRVLDNGTGIEMVLIPPGTFEMGCSASNAYGCNSSEFPVHAVTLTEAFYLGRYEVTQAQWTAQMGFNPSTFQSASPEVPAAQVPMRPVDGVSWNAAQGFLSATGLRLPTEAEWEYAYRAGTVAAFHGWPALPSGTNDDTLVGSIAWYAANSAAQTRPVGGKAANGFGVHDIAGNVQEWVNDWFGPSYYASSPSTNPPGPASGFGRVLRGGAWINVTNDTKASARNAFAPDGASFSGFRVARNPS